RVGIGGGVHRDRLDAHFVRSPVDAQCDLAAVGDEDAGNAHDGRPGQATTTSGWSNSTGWAFSTRIAFTVPPAGAVIVFITFIASMISRVSPALTLVPAATNGDAPGSGDRKTVPTIGDLTAPGWLAGLASAAGAGA